MQSVMSHAMLMHYVESHWNPIGLLLAQIGDLSGCGLVPPTGTCSCDDIDEPFVSQGEDGPGTPSSLPSLESQSPSVLSQSSPSPIDSVYYSTSLHSTPELPSLLSQEEFTIVFQGGSTSPSSATLPPSFSGDTGSLGEVDQGGVFEVVVEGLPLLGNEGQSSGGSGSDAVDFARAGY